MGDHGAFLCKAFYVLGFLAQERFWNEERKICIAVTGILEHLVKRVLHLLPDGITIGLDHHAAPDCGILRQVGFDYQVIVPLRVVVTPAGQFFCHIFLFLV